MRSKATRLPSGEMVKVRYNPGSPVVAHNFALPVEPSQAPLNAPLRRRPPGLLRGCGRRQDDGKEGLPQILPSLPNVSGTRGFSRV